VAPVVEVLSRVARSLEAEPDQQRTLAGIVAAVTTTVSGVEYAGITLVEKGKLSTVVPSDPVVSKIDAVQYETGQGPCIDAIAEHATVRTDRLSAETGRWPAFAAAAADMGVESMLAWRLFTTGTTFGALNVYSSRPDAFDEDAVVLGELLAVHAAIALAGARQKATLRAALATRDLIATAKGILVERHHVDSHTAFQMLVKASQDTNVKLYDVAARVIGETTGTTPPVPG
jgi:putative methionine-R-sulfoxide reductase with GAF domain